MKNGHGKFEAVENSATRMDRFVEDFGPRARCCDTLESEAQFAKPGDGLSLSDVEGSPCRQLEVGHAEGFGHTGQFRTALSGAPCHRGDLARLASQKNDAPVGFA